MMRAENKLYTLHLLSVTFRATVSVEAWFLSYMKAGVYRS